MGGRRGKGQAEEAAAGWIGKRPGMNGHRGKSRPPSKIIDILVFANVIVAQSMSPNVFLWPVRRTKAKRRVALFLFYFLFGGDVSRAADVREHPVDLGTDSYCPFHFVPVLFSPLLIVLHFVVCLFVFLLVNERLFLRSSSPPSPVSLWISLALHTLPQRHHRHSYRTLTHRLPVTTSARTALQERIRKASHQDDGLNRRRGHPCTPSTPQLPPHRRFARPRTSTHITYILSRPAKSPHGLRSSTTSYGCMPALASSRPVRSWL